MSNDWKLIARGFAIAILGAGATMSYIVGISALYVGRFSVTFCVLLLAVGAGMLFWRLLEPFLEELARRVPETATLTDKSTQQPQVEDS